MAVTQFTNWWAIHNKFCIEIQFYEKKKLLKFEIKTWFREFTEPRFFTPEFSLIFAYVPYCIAKRFILHSVVYIQVYMKFEIQIIIHCFKYHSVVFRIVKKSPTFLCIYFFTTQSAPFDICNCENNNNNKNTRTHTHTFARSKLLFRVHSNIRANRSLHFSYPLA